MWVSKKSIGALRSLERQIEFIEIRLFTLTLFWILGTKFKKLNLKAEFYSVTSRKLV